MSYKMKILSGNWQDGELVLKNMPKEFILSARELVVMEIPEFENLQKQRDILLAACKNFVAFVDSLIGEDEKTRYLKMCMNNAAGETIKAAIAAAEAEK